MRSPCTTRILVITSNVKQREIWLLVSEPGRKRKWAVLVAPWSKLRNSTTVLHHFSSRIDLDRSQELKYRLKNVFLSKNRPRFANEKPVMGHGTRGYQGPVCTNPSACSHKCFAKNAHYSRKTSFCGHMYSTCSHRNHIVPLSAKFCRINLLFQSFLSIVFQASTFKST